MTSTSHYCGTDNLTVVPQVNQLGVIFSLSDQYVLSHISFGYQIFVCAYTSTFNDIKETFAKICRDALMGNVRAIRYHKKTLVVG